MNKPNKQAGVGDFNELLVFAGNLEGFDEDLTLNFKDAIKAMNKVNENWDDDKNISFMEEFQKSTRSIDEISQLMREYAAYIKRIAVKVEEYKGINLNV